MAKMTSMTLTTPLNGYTVSYTGTCELESKNLTFTEDIPDARDKSVRQEYGISSSYPYTYQISLDGTSYDDGNSTSYSINKAVDGEYKHTLYGRYKYYYREGKWTYTETFLDSGTIGRYAYEDEEEAWIIADAYCSSRGSISEEDRTQIIYSPQVDSFNGGGITYYQPGYIITEREWSIKWETRQLVAFTDPKYIKFYPRPQKFLFDNCRNSGGRWLIEKGINAPYPYGLIYNLTEFQGYANQWMAWKLQNSYTRCPKFDSPLSAARINSIYSTLGKTSNYKSGDPVSVDIFQGLENIINE